METISVSDLANFHLCKANERIGEKMQGFCVFIDSPIFPPLDTEFRVVVENIRQSSGKSKRRKLDHLIVILRTRGGLMESVERLVSIMRHHFKKVSFIIPDFAYSAGTVLALSGDDIYMDYFSVLGPIDPQFKDGERSLPGIGYLTKFQELLESINEADDKSRVHAEIRFLLSKFDPALLFNIEQAVEHGQSLIETWLPKYKFKDWKTTQGTGKTVNKRMRKERARLIAQTLGDATK